MMALASSAAGPNALRDTHPGGPTLYSRKPVLPVRACHSTSRARQLQAGVLQAAKAGRCANRKLEAGMKVRTGIAADCRPPRRPPAAPSRCSSAAAQAPRKAAAPAPETRVLRSLICARSATRRQTQQAFQRASRAPPRAQFRRARTSANCPRSRTARRSSNSAWSSAPVCDITRQCPGRLSQSLNRPGHAPSTLSTLHSRAGGSSACSKPAASAGACRRRPWAQPHCRR